MKLILLSGGSGKRLWPLSNDSRSKQFLKVLKNDNNEFESMVQRVWNQLHTVGLAEDSYVATSKSQVDMLHAQLGTEVPLIIEPERRDTFPAIALAATYLYSMEGVREDDVISVLPVDPYVESRFFDRVKDLETALVQSSAELALIGVKPTFPSEKYGYIVPKKGEHDVVANVLAVDYFVEKPSTSRAQELMKQQAFWNCGIFAFKLGYLISLLKEKKLPTDYEEMLHTYNQLPKISFDYEVVEKAQNIIMLPYEGEWKDLGTWNTLTEEMNTNLLGKGIISEGCENTHLINELDIPVTILGISNAVIAASPDGILVTDKEASPRIKDIMKNFNQRPMYEERRWGWYRVLDHTKVENGNEVLTKRIGVHAGKNLSYQIHHKRSEVWTIISGEGQFVLNDQLYHVKPGDVLQIPVGAKHAIRAITDLQFVEVQTGSELIEEDIIRLCMTWEETLDCCKDCIVKVIR
ncbi:sugar phosphate nucleotidyltransferase [Aneurinibacillus thermoaerophilus]|uniref:Mannose-1-phosphate guanylyltransferase n=1 Tax=Aneurinibacillus thermoaerophilus TaxID=143495 RepID=Q6T1V9_ANETH|nr:MULTISPECIES: sugar phosphate nucleotidyltransferase [Aneurinibacillus]AAS55729.1 mannose-1-phosphate guanylyltransferase [Aneurinibacillus thermoaerophilus]AMA71701.1 mannose-1-phosphate guanylyltransferase [Aneurinibacillus sp. XH2]MED0757803.1 sugar phosphate nucleotidyltransferase [Aneurinibacillus thermoaerophilus]MED0761513.1 sugar phosphate nucleotidyltransferase [Aneurinibacillus thermoaerophilus]SDH58572.1 mannose-1-phosphate guanylyltransferase [Aneurinibacillus thermoaerophilus]